MPPPDPLQPAIEHHRDGRFAEAEAGYRTVLQRNPNDARALHLLGTALLQSRRPKDAVTPLRRAAELVPQLAPVHFALGDALRFTGDVAGAEAAYRKCLAINPAFAPAYNGLGLALVHQQKMDSAITAWRRAVELKPDYAEGHANLGAALAQQKRLSEAASSLRQALHLNPSFAPAHNNLANVLNELEEFDAALGHWTKAVELQPKYFDAMVNLSKALHDRAKLDESLDLLERAIAVKPDDPDARFLRGLALLLKGDLARGFEDYRFRSECRDLNLHGRTFPQPAWDGGNVAGKTILLHAEQGLGDTIQFIRYAPLLAERGARVIVESPPDLAKLLESVRGVTQVVPRSHPLPAFDIHAPILDLPRLFRTTLETIPSQVPYITPDPAHLAHWRDVLADDPPGKRVGLVWSGNPKHTNDRRRSIPFRQFDSFADLPNITFFSLQKGPAAGQASDSTLRLRLVDHTARLTDFSQTAALISHLDLVITVDTSVAHLAGALGKPIWVLLPHVPDWRWMIDRTESPWYPSMKLFRQPSIGAWQPVIAQIKQVLLADAPTARPAG
jgi:tetratricopeptide (TPR) repeat protein